MISPPVNIIKKQVVELDIISGAAALTLQHQAQEWCNRQLLPALEAKLERYASIPEVLRIDNLLIEIDYTGNDFDEQLVQKIADELETKLIQHGNLEAEGVHIEKKEKRFFDLLLFYLQHGYLPWWSSLTGKSSFEEQLGQWIRLLDEQADIDQLKIALQQDLALKRLLSVIPSRHQWLLFEKLLNSASANDIGQAILQLEGAIAHYADNFSFYINTPAPFHQQFQSIMSEALLKWAIYRKAGEQSFPLGIIAARTMRHAGFSGELIRKIFDESNLKKTGAFTVTYDQAFSEPLHLELSRPVPELSTESKPPEPAPKQPKLQTAEEGIYISNAGLVLVARYLNDFFERTGLRQDKQFVHPALAVAALQWMANGSEEPAEFELVLPKILCGFELQQPLPQVKEIPAFIKQEAHDLLESLIKHWSILKNTSVEGLRASFLQRQGKLSRVNDHWLLQVEQKSYDMLLEHLPWSISIIKLSFMKEAIYVEWC